VASSGAAAEKDEGPKKVEDVAPKENNEAENVALKGAAALEDAANAAEDVAPDAVKPQNTPTAVRHN